MVELSLLEQLSAFARHGTLTAAAESLHLSQSALSRSMQQLESELGVPLFRRGKNRLSLTDAGQLAAAWAERLLTLEREMAEEVRAAHRRSRTISLGCCAPVPQGELVALLSRLYEGVTVSSVLGDDEELLRGLVHGDHHLAILHRRPGEESGLRWVTCGQEKLSVVVPRSHPLADSPGLYLSDLAGQRLLLYTDIGFWRRMCEDKIPGARFLMQTDRETLAALVESSTLPYFITDQNPEQIVNLPVADDRAVVPVLDPEANVTYYLVCLPEQTPRFSALFQALSN